MKDVIRFASVGLNNRGYGQTRLLMEVPGVEIVALCDVYEDLCERSADAVEEYSG